MIPEHEEGPLQQVFGPTLPAAVVEMHRRVRFAYDRMGGGIFTPQTLALIAVMSGAEPYVAPAEEPPVEQGRAFTDQERKEIREIYRGPEPEKAAEENVFLADAEPAGPTEAKPGSADWAKVAVGTAVTVQREVGGQLEAVRGQFVGPCAQGDRLRVHIEGDTERFREIPAGSVRLA